MITAGIVIDAWKLPIFEKWLKRHGYEYEKSASFIPETLTLRVKTLSVSALQDVLTMASNEADRTGPL